MSKMASKKLPVSRVLKGINMGGIRIRHIDAKEQIVGRLASQIAMVLQGKDKPSFRPHEEDGDVVVVSNARYVEFTGRKWDQKLYRHHTGFSGGLKEVPVKKEFFIDPTRILFRAVNGMLPKNKLRQARAKKLRIYPDADHPFKGDPRLVEMVPRPKNLRSKEPLFSLPEGFEPMNRDAYRKRFAHMLPRQVTEMLRTNLPASSTLPAKE